MSTQKGIQSLEDYLQENGRESLVNLLVDKKIQVTEKINAHRVRAIKEKTGNVAFYTKRGKEPLKTIDRIYSDLYENFIKHILNNKDNLPIGEHCFYFTETDLDVQYTNKPKNNIILTNTTSSVDLSKIANDINVVAQSTIFDGYVNRLFAELLISYIEGQIKNSLQNVFISYFGESAKSILTKTSDDIIEGYTLRIDGILYKITDKRFERHVFSKVNTSGYEMLIMDISSFVADLDFTEISIDAKNKDMKYAQFIYEAYNLYIKSYGPNIDSVLIAPPGFITKIGKLGVRFISNKETLNNLKNEKYEYLLRVFLNIFNDKLVSRGLLTEDFINEHNALVLHINNYVNKTNSIIDFNQFKKFRNQK